MTLALYAVMVVGVIEIGVTWWLFRGLRRLDRLDGRLSQLTEALRLLTETTEAGFRASAQELTRLADQVQQAPAPAPRAASARTAAAKPAATRSRARAGAAVRKGRGVQDLAPTESMSEGELRLRLHLAETGATRVAGAKDTTRALRA